MDAILFLMPFVLSFGWSSVISAFSDQPAGLLLARRSLALTPPSPSQSGVAKGEFLVASKRLGDPNFAETVVLLIEYNENGAMGVVITADYDLVPDDPWGYREA